MIQVQSIEHLKELAHGDQDDHEFFILVAGGAVRSSKTVLWDEPIKLFLITNQADDSEQDLTEEELMDENITNIGKAIEKGAFYKY